MGMVSSGVSVGSQKNSDAQQGYAAVQNEKYLESTERQKTKIARGNAASSWESGQLAVGTEAAQRQQAIHAGTATFAANGVQVDAAPTDSATMWKEDQQTQLGRDLEVIMRNAQSESWNYSNEAKMHKAAAANHQRNQTNANRRAAITIVSSGLV
jgi:hypothetical protein